jgi:hypothetical protein
MNVINFIVQINIMKRLTSHFLSCSVLILFFVLVSLFTIDIAPAAASTKVTFRWRPNPPEEFVAGYRLYYGSKSRFNSDKTLKANFSYTYRIDFVDQTRCSGPGFSSCTQLSSNDLQCRGLFAETPSCTVSNLDGVLYFAMTAYTNSAESGYTYELKFPQKTPAFLTAINLLLLKK